jgi:RecQ family ATP-dependent DNA helicase
VRNPDATSPGTLIDELALTLPEAMALRASQRNTLLRFLIEWERYEAARALLEPLVESAPDRLSYRVQLCRARIGLGEIQRARKEARAVYALPTGRIPGLLLAAELHLASGRPEYAEAILARCTAAGVLCGAALRRTAFARLQAGNLEGAGSLVADWARAVDQNEPSAERQTSSHRDLIRLELAAAAARGDWKAEAAARSRLTAAFESDLARLTTILQVDGQLDPRPDTEVAVTHTASVPPTPEAPELRPLLSALQAHFGHPSFRPGQADIIAAVLGSRPVLGIMPTGAGKSVCFQLPAMLLPRATVVISPLIALMKDQVDGLPPTVQRCATLVNSQLDSGENERRMAEIACGARRLVYAAPERLRQRPFLHALRRSGVSLFVVDEAHCVSLWGHDFRPDYLFIAQVLGDLSQGPATTPEAIAPAVLALTATATSEIQKDVARRFGVDFELVNLGTFRPNLALAAIKCHDRDDKWTHLSRLCAAESGPIIVYVDRRDLAETLARRLRDLGIAAGHYHAGMEREEREAAQDAFMSGQTRVVAATVAFGMGIDKADIRMVVHFNLPRSVEAYYQEAGRAGRDGLRSQCVLLFTPSDKANMTRRARESRFTVGEILRVFRAVEVRLASGERIIQADDLERDLELEDTRLRVALGILQQAGALVRGYDVPQVFSLRWLGAAGDPDFTAFVAAARLVARQRITLPATDLASAAGIALEELEDRLLTWQERRWIEARGSARGLSLTVLGDARAHTNAIRSVLETMLRNDERRLSLLAGFAETHRCRQEEIARYFAATVPPACGICDNCCRRGVGSDSTSPDTSPRSPSGECANALFERLRDWRREAAKERNLPAYCVAPDALLRRLAEERPTDLPALTAVVGPARAQKHGAALLALVRRFRIELESADPRVPPAPAGSLSGAWQRLRQFWQDGG